MIFSMTGYGSHSSTLSSRLSFRVELFSVNGKGITVNLKCSFLEKAKELQIKDKITEQLKRGTVECFLYFERPDTQSPDLIDKRLFGQYVREISELSKTYDFDKDSLVSSFFSLPNIFKQDEALCLEEEENMFKAIEQAIKNIVDYRKREGAKLKEDLLKQLEFIFQQRVKIVELEPQRKQKVKEHLLKDLQNLSTITIDENRFHQELIYYIEKIDIHEELTRLDIHCKYLKEFIEEKDIDYKGKKIGFILQEIAREINTLGAKSNMIEIQQIVVDLKDVVEKMKEQSLNIL